MRELLFRGKNKKNGEWVFSHSIYIRYYQENIDCVQMIDEKTDLKFMNRYFEIDKHTVGQWTGLLDSKGNKIFEGDIVTYEDCGGYPTYSEYLNIGKIGYDDGMLYLTERYSVDLDDLIHNGIMDCEVVGNIYDNPTMIEEFWSAPYKDFQPELLEDNT